MPPVRQKSDASCAGLCQQRRDTPAGDGVEAAGIIDRPSARPRGIEQRKVEVAQAAVPIRRETALGPKWNTAQAIAAVALTLLFLVPFHADGTVHILGSARVASWTV
jgi:hypothetical protein